MGFVQILVLLLTYGPTLVKLVREILALIKGLQQTKGLTTTAQEDYKGRLRKALDHFKKTRDKGLLERLRDELK